MKPVEVNVNFHTAWKHQKTTDLFMFLADTKENIDPKWAKQQQYRREWHNLMLLA